MAATQAEVREALERLTALRVELQTMLEQVEEVAPLDVPARRQRIADVLKDVEDAERMATRLEEQGGDDA